MFLCFGMKTIPFVLLFFAFSITWSFGQDIRQVNWMVGNWGSEDSLKSVSLSWLHLNDHQLKGTRVRVSKEGAQVQTIESLLIEMIGGDASLLIQTNGKASKFEMDSIASFYVRFHAENPNSKFESVVYKRAGKYLVVEEVTGGESSSMVFQQVK